MLYAISGYGRQVAGRAMGLITAGLRLGGNDDDLNDLMVGLAPRAGLEPATQRLTEVSPALSCATKRRHTTHKPSKY